MRQNKIAAGVALALIAFGAAASPANAMTAAPESSAVLADRYEGTPFLQYEADPNADGYGAPFVEGETVKQTARYSAAGYWNVPAPTTTGEIRADGLCLTIGPSLPFDYPKFTLLAQQCDGSSEQQFTILEDGKPTPADARWANYRLYPVSGSYSELFLAPGSSTPGSAIDFSELGPVDN